MQIRVSPEILRNVAQRQENIKSNIVEETEKINNLSNQLVEAWQGAAGDQVHDVLEDIRMGIKNILDGMGERTQKLISFADAFESIDGGDVALAFRQLPTGWTPMPPIRPSLVLSVPGLVRIDTGRVREITQECTIVSNSISDNIVTFSDSVNGLAENWEGRAYAKYKEEAYEIINALRETLEGFNEFIMRARNAADLYEEIDNSF